MVKVARYGLVFRRLGQLVWIGTLSVGVIAYVSAPQVFTAENIAAFLARFHGVIWLIYVLFSALRGMTLLPSTPLVIAGTLLFPEQHLAVFSVSLFGVWLSSSLIYLFSEHLGLSEYFESHKPELTHRVKQRLERPTGFLFVAAWAFFPLVPTDLVCYLAGTTKMRYIEFIGAVLLGESILCSIYVFFGGSLVNLFR